MWCSKHTAVVGDGRVFRLLPLIAAGGAARTSCANSNAVTFDASPLQRLLPQRVDSLAVSVPFDDAVMSEAKICCFGNEARHALAVVGPSQNSQS